MTEITLLEFEAYFRVVQFVKRKIVNAVGYFDRNIQIQRGHPLRFEALFHAVKAVKRKILNAYKFTEFSLLEFEAYFREVEFEKRKIVNGVSNSDRRIQIQMSHS